MSDTAVRPRIDPRFARRLIEVRREAGRRRLRFVAVVVALVALAALAVGSLYTPMWKVRHVRVSVSGPLSPAKVAQLSGLGRHRVMIDVDAARIARRLDAVPILGAARVSRQWPSTVRISVSVRVPVAMVEGSAVGSQASRWLTVDVTGRVLASSATPPAGLPVIVGISSPPAVGAWIDGTSGPTAVPRSSPSGLVDMNAASDSPRVPAGAAAALAAIAALPATVRPDVLVVTVGSNDLSMTVLPATMASGSIAVDLGDGSQLAHKLSALTTLLTQADLSNIQSIDLTVPDRPAALTAR